MIERSGERHTEVKIVNMEINERNPGWEESAEAWLASIERGEASREGILDPVMLEWVGNSRGQSVVDIGCGEGRFMRLLGQRGWDCYGLDPTGALVRAATAKGCRVVRGVAEHLPFASQSVDLVVFYVVLIDVSDHVEAVREAARILKPGGRIVSSNLNPFMTSKIAPWQKGPNGERYHVAVDDYHESRADWVEWSGIRIQNWHRSMQSYVQAFLGAGLRLRRFVEPVPSPQAIKRFPGLESELRVPTFHVMEWQKE